MASAEPAVDAAADLRQRAIRTARQLAEEGGYDAVQIRDVVARTGLSSATIYRHFSSKDHLIAAAHLEWVRLFPPFRGRVARGATASDRVVALLHQACRAMEASPNFGKALVFALGAADAGVRECRAEGDRLIMDALREAIGDEMENPDDVIMAIGFAWQGALFSWAHERLTMAEVDRQLERTARLLMAGAAELGA